MPVAPYGSEHYREWNRERMRRRRKHPTRARRELDLQSIRRVDKTIAHLTETPPHQEGAGCL